MFALNYRSLDLKRFGQEVTVKAFFYYYLLLLLLLLLLLPSSTSLFALNCLPSTNTDCLPSTHNNNNR